MKFCIDESLFAKFPALRIGLVVAKGVDNKESNEIIRKKLRETEQEIKRELTLEDVPTLPQILVWRNAYLSFGANPNKFRNSAEALLRRVLNGKELPAIN